MSGYKSTATHAAEIRAAYKARGWTSRMVSVRTSTYSMGSSIRVEIKSPEIDAGEAERIAEEHESIRSCEYSGEILSGGNRFVNVGYSDGCREILARRHVQAVEAAMDLLAPGDYSTLVPVAGTTASIGREGSCWFQLWHEDGPGRTFANAAEAAFQLATYRPRFDADADGPEATS
jgi:hypothetical protein